MWKLIKRYKKKHSSIPPLTVNNEVKYDNDEKANAFTDQFGILSNQNNTSLNNNHTKLVNSTVNKYLTKNTVEVFEFKVVHPHKVVEILRTFKNNKAPGCDFITPIMLKNISYKSIVMLTKIFERHVQCRIFPIVLENR